MNADKGNWQSAEEVLTKFDENKDGALDYEEFKKLCDDLFGAEEVKDADYRLRDIFDILDRNGDGLLDGDEWQR